MLLKMAAAQWGRPVNQHADALFERPEAYIRKRVRRFHERSARVANSEGRDIAALRRACRNEAIETASRTRPPKRRENLVAIADGDALGPGVRQVDDNVPYVLHGVKLRAKRRCT